VPQAVGRRWGRAPAGAPGDAAVGAARRGRRLVGLATTLVLGRHAGWVVPGVAALRLRRRTHGGGASEAVHAYTHRKNDIGRYQPRRLAPYLLSVDYFNPTSVWITNLAFLAMVGATLCLVMPRPRVGAMVVDALFVVGSSVRFYVPYAPQVDSLYVLFSTAFVALAMRLNAAGGPAGMRRVLLWLGMVVTWFLPLTSKEIQGDRRGRAPGGACLPAHAAGATDRPRWRIVAPFMVWSAVNVAAYVHASLQSANLDPNHTARPSLANLHSVRDMLVWGLGLHAPASQRPNWEFQFDRWITVLAALAIGAGLVADRRAAHRPLCADLCGSCSHHRHVWQPAVSHLPAGRGSGSGSCSFSALRWRASTHGPRVRRWWRRCALVAVALAQVAVARHVATRSVDQGPQTVFLEASMELPPATTSTPCTARAIRCWSSRTA